MGLFPSANVSQKSVSFYVFREPLYQICEVYIDDLLIYGDDDQDFVANVRTIFKNAEKNGNIKRKKNVPWFWHCPICGTDSTGINMSQTEAGTKHNKLR